MNLKKRAVSYAALSSELMQTGYPEFIKFTRLYLQ